ncbi:hypothetical protein JMJ35_000822 [Cladonia borealis]|uniref:Uncharacterized protein n=1 Tax=Cladonia borealis TaxID=184061 RepID=A0AA39R9R8_9LECA|nr:hypothetical protein JMJ35_000822 [Cladonia borealis]
MRIIDIPCLTVLSQLFVAALNAVPPASSILSPVLLANNTIYEFSNPDNTTFANATNILPSSPWVYNVPDTFIKITVRYSQVVFLSEADMLVCLLNAAIDVINHLAAGSSLIGERELHWDSDPAVVIYSAHNRENNDTEAYWTS